MGTFDLVLTVLSGAFIVLLILLFEKKRAQKIERDLRDGAAPRPDASGPTDPPGDGTGRPSG